MTGGLVLCGTHNNQFVDALCLIAYFPREINFLVAAVVDFPHHSEYKEQTFQLLP